MLYTLHGTDFKKTRKNLRYLVESLLKRKPDSNVFSLNQESFSVEVLTELMGSQGLFAEKYITILDGCLVDKDMRAQVLGLVKDIAKSENLFIIIEEKLDAKSKAKLEKYSEQSKVYDTKEILVKKVNPFIITESLGKKDKKSLWVEYNKALLRGSAPEEVHGILLWQIKSMMLVRGSKSAEGAGLKPFVYRKSQKFLQNYRDDSLDILYRDMVKAYHEARRGKVDMREGVEAVILGL